MSAVILALFCPTDYDATCGDCRGGRQAMTYFWLMSAVLLVGRQWRVVWLGHGVPRTRSYLTVHRRVTISVCEILCKSARFVRFCSVMIRYRKAIT